MNLEWEPGARTELHKAACLYHAEDPERAYRFVQTVENAVGWIQSNPEAPRQFEIGYRKKRLDGFPYTVIYTVKEDTIFVVGFVHQSRHPDYWKQNR